VALMALMDDGNVVHTTDDQWGITLPLPWGPPSPSANPTDPPGVSGYTFRISFLPVPPAPGVSTTLPPTYWAQEVRQYLGVGAGDQILADPDRDAQPGHLGHHHLSDT
jgi:hypothetical protein